MNRSRQSHFVIDLWNQDNLHWSGSASLSLPATAEEIEDCYERAHATRENGVVEVTQYKPEFLYERLPENLDLLELNYLSERLATLDEGQLDFYEALVLLEDTPPDMKTLINLTFNVDGCVMIDASSVREVGEFAVEYGFYSQFDALEDDVLKSLDYVKLGAQFVKDNSGIHLRGRYIFNLADRKEMSFPYDGTPPEAPTDPDHSMWLRFQSPRSPDSFVDLALSADEVAVAVAAKEIGEIALTGTPFSCFRSIVPQLHKTLSEDADFDELNAVAQKLLGIRNSGELMKLKAIIEHNDCVYYETLVLLMDELDSYGFLPEITNPSDYGEQLLRDECGLDGASPFMKHIDLTAIGMEWLSSQDASITSYGLVRRLDPKQELTAEENPPDQVPGMGM